MITLEERMELIENKVESNQAQIMFLTKEQAIITKEMRKHQDYNPRIDALEDNLTKQINNLNVKINKVEERLTEKINDVEEKLTNEIKDLKKSNKKIEELLSSIIEKL